MRPITNLQASAVARVRFQLAAICCVSPPILSLSPFHINSYQIKASKSPLNILKKRFQQVFDCNHTQSSKKYHRLTVDTFKRGLMSDEVRKLVKGFIPFLLRESPSALKRCLRSQKKLSKNGQYMQLKAMCSVPTISEFLSSSSVCW